MCIRDRSQVAPKGYGQPISTAVVSFFIGGYAILSPNGCLGVSVYFYEVSILTLSLALSRRKRADDGLSVLTR